MRRLKRRIDLFTLVLLILSGLLMTAALAGCGKKGDPVPRQQTRLERIDDLEAKAVNDGVLLTWTIPGRVRERYEYFRIWRAAWGPGDDVCPGCPLPFTLLVKTAAENVSAAAGSPGGCLYLDRKVVGGHSYRYRVDGGSSAGPVSEQSNMVEIIFKP